MTRPLTHGAIPPAEPMIISLRAYTEPAPNPNADEVPAVSAYKGAAPPRPVASDWTLIFDCETMIDAGQALRFGGYQVRKGGELWEAGLFYEPDAIGVADLAVLTSHAAAHGLKLITREAFVEEVFYGVGHFLRATIVGFNLPYDLSRLAIGHASARGDMRGGFSLKLTTDKRRPAVQVKHLSQRASLIRFAAPFRQRSARSDRKRGNVTPVRRGFFVDLRTFGGAMFARSFSLAGLGEFLEIDHPKLETDAHGETLTDAYVAYAVRDVQTTWECFVELARRHDRLGLKDTAPSAVFSEASIGKGYLRAMGVKPWREVQPDAPHELLAKVMNSYFGGRSEVRIRRELRQVVLCDFLSMYPTVCTLMGLWPFVIASGMTWRTATDEVQAFMDGVTLADLQRPATWPKLGALVQVEPEGDVLPVRGHFQDEVQATIGLSHLTSEAALWFTLAECVASKVLTGRTPKIRAAIAFMAGEPQAGLAPALISGNAAYRVDPVQEDFFKRLIELRHTVKARRDAATGSARDRLDTEQNTLKIVANATSYGGFVEINVKEKAKPKSIMVHGATAPPYPFETVNVEEPGQYFHPLLATLITGAARLMLAITERLVLDNGLEWSFCDTDSMAPARPPGMSEAEFHTRVDRIVDWFSGLNPYDFGGSILRIEDVNFTLNGSRCREPLFCWAVSAKRYALFNIGPDGRPILRKASAHGLGHLRTPYKASDPAEGIPSPIAPLATIGIEHWQHDVWWSIVSAALAGRPDQVDFGFHAALDEPAISRYAATTPVLLKWFKGYNLNLPYERQVKPFGFMLALFADQFTWREDCEELVTGASGGRRKRRALRPVAPFDKDYAKAVLNAFDRETGEPVPGPALKTFREVLGVYHLHPESKFLNGDYLDRGVTRRRHVRATGVRLIGKEANRWEEQHFLGLDEDAQPDYGSPPGDLETQITMLRLTAKAHGVGPLARKAGMPASMARRVLRRGALARPGLLQRLAIAGVALEAEASERARLHGEVLKWGRKRVEIEGLGAFARRIGINARNFAKVMAGKRPLPSSMVAHVKGSVQRRTIPTPLPKPPGAVDRPPL